MKRASLRAMWLLNHTSARKFEIPMLKASGINEIFLPKFYPNTSEYRSGSIDWTEDRFLTIPQSDLDVLNKANWYGLPGQQAWEIANKHFDVAFFIANNDTFREISDNFTGAIIYRAYGLDKAMSYRTLLNAVSGGQSEHMIRKLGDRFWFGEVFDNIHDIEPPYLATRSIHLPLGIMDSDISEGWIGTDKRILFVCPDIEGNAYYNQVYRQFKTDFAGFDYAIGGAQYQPTNDPRVLGFLPFEEHLQNMRNFRLMFYHSSEPRHIHYHPIEAIKSGMPLIFMAGGILDKYGGIDQPGRCTTIGEARQKARQLLDGDIDLMLQIRRRQIDLLEPISRAACERTWQQSISKVAVQLSATRALQSSRKIGKPLRIAVLLPTEHRGGILVSAKQLAKAISIGSENAGEPAEVVFGHLDVPTYADKDFIDLPENIRRRPFRWRSLNSGEAVRACAYAGHTLDVAPSASFQIPDDGMAQFTDCDLIVLASDRMLEPLLPIYRYGVVVHDVLQRYFNVFPRGVYESFQACARRATRVITTTEFTRRDLMQFSGISRLRISTIPPIIPSMQEARSTVEPLATSSYFVWPTNLGPHKNHENALAALALYYDSEGPDAPECHVIGPGSDQILTSELDHIRTSQELLRSNRQLRNKVIFRGELSDRSYRRLLCGSRFLFHPTTVDNGTYAVLEAATIGIPSLSNDYPAMREVCKLANVCPTWMDASSPREIADALIEMTHREIGSLQPPEPSRLSVETLAQSYWSAVRAMIPLRRISEAASNFSGMVSTR